MVRTRPLRNSDAAHASSSAVPSPAAAATSAVRRSAASSSRMSVSGRARRISLIIGAVSLRTVTATYSISMSSVAL